jgi:hypothetical protein
MPVFRIVYIDEVSLRPHTLTEEFPSRAAAQAALERRGHRIAHVAEMRPGESVTDPIVVPMAGASAVRAPGAIAGAALSFSGERRPASAGLLPALGLPIYDIAAVGVVVAGALMASAALVLF